MFLLRMNDMRSTKSEIMTNVLASDSTDKIRDFVNMEVAEARYQDGQWDKVYRKGGPLEWYNDIGMQIIPILSLEDNIAAVTRSYNEFMRNIMHI